MVVVAERGKVGRVDVLRVPVGAPGLRVCLGCLELAEVVVVGEPERGQCSFCAWGGTVVEFLARRQRAVGIEEDWS